MTTRERWRYDLPTTPTRIRTPPPMYFGGTSEPAREVAAEHADCYLMWIERVASIGALVAEIRERAAAHGRTLRFGLRTHVIVRDTEDEARGRRRRARQRARPRDRAPAQGGGPRPRSEGVRRQDALRASAGDDGFAEEALWTGIGVARSGVGAAITGSTQQVVAKLRAYEALGVDAFILSGYPLDDEAERVGRLVLPGLRGADVSRGTPLN